MKKWISLLLCLSLMLSLSAVNGAGTFLGKGASKIGGEGALAVEVSLGDDGAITAIEVVENKDTPGISDPAVAAIPAAIIAEQSLLVDVMAGATYTSEAILLAVRDALTQAGADLARFEKAVEVSAEKEDDLALSADVVIIGAGGAGITAAVQANMNGATVLVLEKMPKIGGNTIMAGGALNAVDDRSETAIKNNDSVEFHYQQTLAGGDFQGDPALVHILVSRAWEAVEWIKELGMGFLDGTFTVTGGL